MEIGSQNFSNSSMRGLNYIHTDEFSAIIYPKDEKHIADM